MSRIADAFQKLLSSGSNPAPETPSGDTPPPDVIVPWSIEDFTSGVARGAAPDRAARHASMRAGVTIEDRTADESDRRAGLLLSRAGTMAAGLELAARRHRSVPKRDLLHYRDVLRRRWKTGAAVFLVVAGGVAGGVLLLPSAYRATGLLEIRPEATGSMPVESMFSSERMWKDDLETQFGVLRSTAVAQRALSILKARAAAARPHPATPPGPGATSAAVTLPGRPEDLQKALTVNPQVGSRLVEVSFQGPDAVGAAGVVNAVIDSYLQLRMEEAQRTADWLGAQLRDAQGRLDTSERQLQAYVREHGLQVSKPGAEKLPSS